MAEPSFRTADRADVPVILSLLNGDAITAARESGATGGTTGSIGTREPGEGADTSEDSGAVSESVDARYWAAFEAIDADPRNELIVMELAGEVAGTCQLTFVPGLSRGGAERMTIESVHVRADLRGRGLGRRLMAWALEHGRERGCVLAQLTSDKRRAGAHRFYTGLGFDNSHEGFKISL